MNFIDKPIDIAGSRQTAAVGQKVVNLALQGGGSDRRSRRKIFLIR
jgi:hypothetical protein